MPEVHINKLLLLVRQCFDDAYSIDTLHLRRFDYAIVAQQSGVFIGVLFVRQREVAEEACHEDFDSEMHCGLSGNAYGIHYFCVHPRFRRYGIGTQLLEHCQEDVEKNGVLFAGEYDHSINNSATSLFLKLGFHREQSSGNKVTFRWSKQY